MIETGINGPSAVLYHIFYGNQAPKHATSIQPFNLFCHNTRNLKMLDHAPVWKQEHRLYAA